MNSNLRIIHIIPYFSDLFGGPPIMLRELATEFAAEGIKIDIITTDVNFKPEGELVDDWLVSEDGYRVIAFPCPDKWRYYTSPSMAKWLWRNLKYYDVVHVHCALSFPAIFGSFTAWWKKIPFVLTPHGNFNPWAFAYKGQKKRLFHRVFGRWLYSKASYIQVLSPEAEQAIKKLGITAPLKLIPNGVHEINVGADDRKSFLEAFPEVEGRKVFTFLGRLAEEKGLERLIESFAILYKEYGDSVVLVLAGPDLNGYKGALKEIIEKFACTDGVVFTGMLRARKKRGLLSLTDMFCLTSWTEGFSIALLESMSLGICCLVSPECNAADAAKEGALVEVHAGASFIESYSSEMKRLIGDDAARAEIGKRASAYVENHHRWNVLAKKILELYDTNSN